MNMGKREITIFDTNEVLEGHAIGGIPSIHILSIGQQHGGANFPSNADIFGGCVEHFFYYLKNLL